MMPQWTVEQKSAIDRRGCDLLVSAAAGSGKTAVLSERVLKRVTEENPVSVDRLLIVTFTEAAAAEMRQRIVEKLRSELVNSPNILNISRQLSLVPKASITTIHSFCLNIIKNNFHLIDIDPAFGILDEAEKELMCAEAAMETINEMYETEGNEFSKVSVWLSSGKDESLAEVIIGTYKYIQSFENPFGWLENQIELYNVSGKSIDDLPWTQLLKTKIKIEFTDILNDYTKVLDLVSEAGSEKTYEIYLAEQRMTEQLLAACTGEWQDIYNAALAFDFATVRADKNADAELLEIAKKLRDDCKEKCRENLKIILGTTVTEALQSLEKAYPLIKCFLKALKLFDEKFTLKKREKNVIDFNDFEHLALRILQDEALPVAKQLREKFDEIYVDEYQDCNAVQEAIFASIARRSDGKTCNMFMVGDVKQSIYKFRQADPEIFIGKLKIYEHEGLQSKVMLNKNFRSRKEVVDCVNSVFSNIMSLHIGGLEYDENEALYPGLEYPSCNSGECGGKSEIIMVTEDETDEEISRIGLEARVVAGKIKEMAGRFQVFDVKNNCYRAATYKDFAILLRNPGGKAEEVENELKQAGIPCFSDKGAALFDVHEIELLISALEITDNPLQDIPLIGFMRSIPGGFSENDLFEIRQFNKKGYFYNAVKKCCDGNSQVSEKCREFVSMVKCWRKYAKTFSVYKLIGKIMDDVAYLPYIQTLPAGKNRRANVELLCEYAKKFENSGARGVFTFLRYIEKLEKSGGSEAARTLSDSFDVVKIMSIHKSKGLEFPVVFLMNGASKINDTDWTKNKLMLHKEYGIGCDFVDAEKKIKYPLLSREAVAYKLKLDGLSEEMRVLYVAMTRAREKLFVTVSGKRAFEKAEKYFSEHDEKAPSKGEVQSAYSYFEWILLSMYGVGKSLWDISVVDPSESLINVEISSEKNLTDKLSDVDKEEINRRLSYEYAYKKSIALASKYSVTELKNKFSPVSDEGRAVYKSQEEILPRFMTGKKFTSAMMGTILHLILKFVDFDAPNPESAVEKCKKYLSDNNFLTEEEIKAANNKVILNFLNSDICREINNAEVVYRELPFNIEFSGDIPTNDKTLADEKVLLQGVIDCLYITGDTCRIVDYKTESVKNTEEELEEMYRKQLELYRYAAEKITGKPVDKTYLYLLNRGKLHEVKF